VAWIVRLVQIGADGEEPFADVMTIDRPDDLDDIANLGLTVCDGKQVLAGLQQEIVAAQARSHSVRRPQCRSCSGVCHVKDGVVQNSPFLGYTGERKPPAFEARFRLRSWPVREAVSLPRSSALRLNGSEAQQRQPMRMALAGHQFSWAFAGALGNPAAHEAAMVQEEL
jgi:hypothetical protein